MLCVCTHADILFELKIQLLIKCLHQGFALYKSLLVTQREIIAAAQGDSKLLAIF